MASLTPGVLSKLLNSVTDKDVKVAGDHRSVLLQVVEILPNGGDEDDPPWSSSRGFFLKVSDSMHSAYVSISDPDLDLIYSDKIQLGQFVYVSRLDSGSPVPVVRGLKPVPRKRPSSFVGSPIDLVPSDLLQIGFGFGFDKPKSNNERSKKLLDLKNNNGNGSKTKARSSVSEARGSLGSPAKKMVMNGSLESRRLSLDSARRGWDHTPTSKDTAQGTASRFKSKQVISDKKASIMKHDSSVKRPSLRISSPLKSKNDVCPPMLVNKTPSKDLNPSSDGTIPKRFIKVPLSSKTWTEQGILWDKFPPAINGLGKQAIHHRNAAFLAAVRSLQEASALESVFHCMCIFAELCDSSQKVSAGSLVQKFLDLDRSLQSAATTVDSLLNTGLLDSKSSSYNGERHCLTPNLFKTSVSKNATTWVKAAVETNLSKFNLFRIQDKGEVIDGENFHYVFLENAPAELNSENCSPKSKQSPRNHGRSSGRSSSDSSSKSASSSSRQSLSTERKAGNERDESLKGSRLKDAASLAQKLLLVSRQWFLKYLEDSLKRGFGLKRVEGGSEMACLLGQLKRVNQWLDKLVMDRIQEEERVEGLRKKLYGFLLKQVDSAVVSSK